MVHFIHRACIFLGPLTLLLWSNSETVCAEESCYWKPDGSQVCEEPAEHHNVWTQDTSELLPESISSILKSLSTDKVESELIVNYFTNRDGELDIEKVEKVLGLDPIRIVQRVSKKFASLDSNNDGKISQEELQEELDKVDENSINQLYPDGISILEYVNLISRINENSDVVLKPFKSLDFLSNFEIRRVIEGSVKMFLEIDTDSNGSLDVEEYLVSLEKDRKKSKMTEVMSAEQKKAIFDMIDKDQSKDISYNEFQAVLPQRPKDVSGNLKEVFKRADLNSDGFLDMEEFETHLKDMSTKMKRPEPVEAEVEEAFGKLDKDEDGLISSEEMNGVLGEIEKLTDAKSTQAFREMDADGDGVLSRAEIETIAQVMEQRSGGEKFDADILIKMLDRNSDGVIQFEEMNELVKRMMPPMKKS